MRLFLGISLSPEFKTLLIENSHEVKEHIDWRSVQPENWHITICFIGDFQGDLVLLTSKIREVIKNRNTFQLNFEGITTVSFNNPKMIWLKGKRNSEFTELVEKLYRVLLNRKPEHKPNPHITIARSKRGIQGKPFKKELIMSNDITEIHLYQSFLNTKGPNYKIIETFHLSEI